MIRLFLSITLLAAAAITTANAITASSVTFEFTGTCTRDCTGTATASLTLLDTYVPGTTDTTNGDFVSFSYSSSFFPSFTIDSASLSSMSVDIPASLPAAANVDIESGGYEFNTSTNGSWYLEILPPDQGINGQWSSAVPEPTMPSLMCLGLAAMLLKRKWRGSPVRKFLGGC